MEYTSGSFVILFGVVFFTILCLVLLYYIFFSYKPIMALIIKIFGINSAGIVVKKYGISHDFYYQALPIIRHGALKLFFSFNIFLSEKILGNPNFKYYSLTVKFSTVSGQVYEKKFMCTADTYNKYYVGDEIEVTYIKNNPNTSLLKEYIDAVTQGWWILLLVIIGILVLIFKSF